MQETTYRFAPHPADGFLLGLRIPQLLGFVVAGALALALLRVGGLGALALALAMPGARGVRAAGAGARPHARAVGAADRAVPARPLRLARHGFTRSGRSSGISWRSRAGGLDPQPPEAPWALPAELADLEFLEARLAQYENARFGVVKDRGARTFTAAVRIRGRAFALLAPEEREERLEEYGAVLAALARDGSPVRRIAGSSARFPATATRSGTICSRPSARTRACRTHPTS